jgi:phosphoglycolate phosphatase
MLGMAVLFDLDGVLVDSRAAFLNSMTLALRDLELPAYPRETLLPCIGPPLKVGFSGLLRTDPDDPRVDALIAAYRGHYATISLTDTTVVPGIVDALEAIAEPLAVATSKPHHFAEPLLRALGLRRHFATVAGPELDVSGETKAQTITRALRGLGTTDAVMVGDRSYDVNGARANNIPCIGVTWGIGSWKELEQSGAAAIIADPLELGPTLRVMSRP